MSNQLVQAVNKQVANWTVLYVKLHNYHWYIKGRHFFTLHEKFEELYNEANEHIDVLAERVLALEGSPVATMRECLEMASVEEASGSEKEEDMVRSICNDFIKMEDELQSAIEIAEEANDEGTADMLLSVKQSLKKHIWMFKAFLG
ncbi:MULTISPECIES: Dps family protein [Bacillaceae]|uniref:General stress protein n=2 Tax=Bacillus infantis TaxID=324767 RepID=U5LEQ7_9BACI|nr:MULTISPECIES: Dps family protein [Bacillus]OXT15335.1 DNA starvation/stationary phase protection protein [Bacillus sp. OG2]AGX05940.1 general stress protein [Bacillus infantis NRRL B-14911]EAR64762.1 DNA-binding ferritin-like protein [Bacillus sp. NRRL B-14911]MCA1037706.1 DNA starvation/stationary phase protection protein [Bacillus infantis]MCK6205215.1 DNA starvation/stationary phase protection protein [Bacillus infantis]